MPRVNNVKKSRTIIPGHILHKTSDGSWQTRKPGLNSKRVKQDPMFLLARQNANEFGHAVRTGKMIRCAFYDFFNKANRSTLASRLLKQIIQALRADTRNVRGQRTLLDGAPEMLEGFQFNEKQPLHKVMSMPFILQLNKNKTKFTACFPSFDPLMMIRPQSKITYFRLVATCGYINMEKGTYGIDAARTGFLPYNKQKTEIIELSCKVARGKGYLNFLAIGIDFFYQEDQVFCPAIGSAADALSIVKVLRQSPNFKT